MEKSCCRGEPVSFSCLVDLVTKSFCAFKYREFRALSQILVSVHKSSHSTELNSTIIQMFGIMLEMDIILVLKGSDYVK